MREYLWLAVAEVGITGLIGWRRHVEQLPGSRDVLGASAVGEETVVADAVETVGQDMDEEAADELVDGERHRLGPLTAVGAVVLPLEGHACTGDADQPAVGDRDAVRIARQIGQHRCGSAERTLAVNDPFGLAQWRQVRSKGMALSEVDMIAEELQAASVVGGEQLCQQQASKQPRQHAHGRKNPGRQDIQRSPSRETPPPGTMMWTCGWWVSAEPQLCSTAVRPIRAPRCFGSAAIVISVSAAALNRMP
jgi:hypothetical protein